MSKQKEDIVPKKDFPKNQDLLYDFMFDYGVKANDILYNVLQPEVIQTYKEQPLFICNTKTGDMEIYYLGLDGRLVTHSKKGVTSLTFRKRLKNPFYNNEGKLVKYLMEGKNVIYYAPEMLEAFKNKTTIETLIVTEGEKKAYVACKNGFDCLGISGIWNFLEVPDKDKRNKYDTYPLLPSLKEFIKGCGVKRICLLHDSDAMDPTISENEPATNRPDLFCQSVKRFAEVIFQEGVQFYYSYINPHLSEEKNGLDDLIKNFEDFSGVYSWEEKNEKGEAVNVSAANLPKLLLDFNKSIDNNQFTTYFCTKKFESVSNSAFKQIFLLNDATEFFNYHKQKFEGLKQFMFYHSVFTIEGGKIELQKKTDRETVWEEKGMYRAYDQKGNPRIISNFTMNVLFLLRSSTQPKRIMEFKNVLGQSFVKELTMDDLVSVSSFRKKLIADGSFIYKGEMFELLHLQEWLFKEEKYAVELTSLGWQKNHRFFAFSNGITSEGKWFPVNEYGIVNYHDTRFYIPAFSNLFTDGDEVFENERNFRHTENDATFTTWANLFYKAYKANGAIAIAFYMAALFRDVVFKHTNKEFPLLNLFGQKGSGKSTVAKSLMYLYGIPQNAISLENASSTKKGIYRKFSQFRNSFIWLDEYKNNVHPDIIGLLKNLYDGIGYERAQTSNDNRTTGIPVLSSTILSGQDMPTIDIALFSRVTLLMFTNNSFDDNDTKAFNELKAYERKGLTAITVKLLSNRQLVEDNFEAEYKKYSKKLKEDFKTVDILERLLNNAAMLLAVAGLLHEKGPHATLPFNLNELYKMFCDMLHRHKSLLNDNQEVSVFWETLEVLSDEGMLVVGRDFKFINDSLAIRFNRAYAAYSEKYRKMHGRTGLDKLTLQNYLKNSPVFIEIKDGVRFDSSPTTAWLFKYKELGISLRIESYEGKKAEEKEEQTPALISATSPIITNNESKDPF